MKKLLLSVPTLLLFLILLTAGGCDGAVSPSAGTTNDALKYCDQNTSLACKEIQARYELFKNADQFGYFYGFIQGDPEPVIVYITQGGVFPLDDMVTPPDKVIGCGTNCGAVQQNQQPDGTWGTNGPNGYFGFLANGQYFEWVNSPFAFSFQPLSFRPPHIEGCPKTGGPSICQ
jgi:hypothetical protein